MENQQEHFKAFSYVAQEINNSASFSSASSLKLQQSLQNISHLFSASNDQAMIRPLFSCLPQEIASSLFGSKDNGKRGLFHQNLQQNDAAGLVEFLSPSSPFILKLLTFQADSSAIYQISPDYLPPLSRRIVQSGEWSLLAAFYKKSLQNISGQPGVSAISPAPGGFQTNPRNLSSTTGPQTSTTRIMFNLFEYYMFCFALCANMVSEKNIELALSSKKSTYPPSLPRFGSVPSINPSSSLVLDKSYYSLVQAYLSFFLPARPPPKQKVPTSPTTISSMNPMTPNRSINAQFGLARSSVLSGPKTSLSAQQTPMSAEILDNSNVFKCTSLENLSHALATAQFAVEVLAEVWLGLNEWEIDGEKSTSALVYAKPLSYIKPSSFHMNCISTLVKYLMSLDLKSVSNEQLSRIYCDRASGQSDVIYDINKAGAYRSIVPKFYRHICLALQHWPRDDSISEVVDQWLYFAFPWKHLSNGRSSSHLTDDWVPFVADNYLFYTRVLQLFFSRALLFDFYASTRPSFQRSFSHSSSSAESQSSQEPAYLRMVERVISCFSDPKLLELLKAIESALCSLKTYNNGGLSSGVVSAISSPIMKSAASSTRLPASAASTVPIRKEKVDIAYQYRNSGPKTRQHVIAFEGRYQYSPVLIQIPDGMKDKNSNLPSRLVSVIWEARERLSHFKLVRATAAQREIAAYNETSMMTSAITAVLSLFMGTVGSSSSQVPLSQEQLAVIDKSIERLESIVDTIADMWSLPNPSQIAPIQYRRTNSDLMGLLQEDVEEETNIKEWAPGVCEPQRVKEIGNVLTLRGRNQIKFGLRKSAAETVPLIQSPRASSLIKGNEIEFLVSFFHSVAVTFDQFYESLRVTNPYLPEKVGLHWIRYFASWDHLLFFVFLYFFLRWLC